MTGVTGKVQTACAKELTPGGGTWLRPVAAPGPGRVPATASPALLGVRRVRTPCLCVRQTRRSARPDTRRADGKIVERWGRLDQLGLLQQLGLASAYVPSLARLFSRPPSSMLAKMANLDGSRSHGARCDVLAGAPRGQPSVIPATFLLPPAGEHPLIDAAARPAARARLRAG
jgi:hypothetical protein